MRVLDLFCSAGGAAMGYHLAWPDAEIVGVDTVPQPNYPFEFVLADAMDFDLGGFDVVHASPPCHDHSTSTGTSRKASGAKGTGWLLEATADRLRGLDVPWVIENVQGATMPAAPCEFRLCGSSFLMDLRRHRKFITNVAMTAPPCAHGWQTPRFPSLRWSKRKHFELSPVVGVHGNTQFVGDRQLRERAMGIDWMTLAELNQAIPPAYTLWIAEQLDAANNRSLG